MEYKRFGKKILARIDKSEEVLQALKSLCEKENIALAQVSAIGAVSEAEIGCFNTVEKKYYSNRYSGIFEIGSLSGTASTMNGSVYLHTHCVLVGIDGSVISGHLNSALVSATCEMVVDIIDGQVDRAFSDEIGLNLLKFK